MKRTFLSMGVVALLAANTYGAGQVWYSATPASGDGTVSGGGPSGALLELSCTSPSTWNVTVTYTTFDGGAQGWALDHYRSDTGLTAGGLVVVSDNFPAGIQNGSVDNSGLILMQGQAGLASSLVGAPVGNHVLMTFVLASANCNGNVFAGIGNAEFGGNDPDDGFGGFYEIVAIGPNLPRAGFSNGGGDPNGAEPLPVISVTPEPSTLALLALSGLALIRRRK